MVSGGDSMIPLCFKRDEIFAFEEEGGHVCFVPVGKGEMMELWRDGIEIGDCIDGAFELFREFAGEERELSQGGKDSGSEE